MKQFILFNQFKMQLIICIFLFIPFLGISQCPTGDLTFTTQAEVDQFIIDFPDCADVESNLDVRGDDPNDPITNLSGLSSIEKIGGRLRLFNFNNLTDFSGLENIEEVGDLVISSNQGLTSFKGLENISSVKDLTISGNPSITSLTGLEGIQTIDGNISIGNNIELTSLTGIEGITSGINNLAIESNPKLSNCSVQSVCNYLDVGGLNTIRFNKIGCDSEQEVKAQCGTCPDVIRLSTQEQIDNFELIYGDACGAELTGNLEIRGDFETITNLSGLSSIESIGGRLNLFNFNNLIDFSGLENIEEVGDLVISSNQGLTSFKGLENISSVKDLTISGNPSITSLTGLEGIQTIDGNISIGNNIELTSLTGIEGITSGINNLAIESNPKLSNCSVQSVCNYLDVGGLNTIRFNKIGCDSEQEVKAQCGTCPDVIRLSTQEQIDNFELIYGDACGAELTGNLEIRGDFETITNLSGLSSIESIGGRLNLFNFNNLIDFSGLENLTEVGRLSINSNQNITDLIGLSGITNIVEELSISNNQALTSLNGLQNIAKAQRLSINNNDVLDNLSGLESLTELSGSINIVGNELLTSLAGIENIASGISSITVSDNPKLTACSIESICSYLEVSNGSFFRNGSGCNNQAEVEAGCAECPETITLSSQEDVDNFTSIYGSSCGTELIGNLTITGAITDLAGISGITKVGGNLTLGSLSNLIDFSGLENLTEVGRLSINSNQNITDLIGLSGITNIVEGLSISNNQSLTSLNGLQNIVKAQRLSINNNDKLDKLSGLESLTELSGSINIVGNELLTSLAGIENIASGISSITVSDNPKLTACSIESICSYLEVSNGSFFRNGSGCNNQAEVEAGCAECPETITLSSQEDVDNFTAIYGSSCGTELIGNLTITGAITDLAGISGITKVGGNLTLSSLSNLTDFSGLENLTEVGRLSINSNQNITDLLGLSGITNIVEGLSISNNQSLTSLNGLQNIVKAQRLSINNNDVLDNLSGLESLTELSGSINIVGNELLTSLAGIENIASGISSITVSDNPKLTACSIESICSYLEVSNGSFFRNGSGCNNQAEVEAGCAECPETITLSSQEDVDNFTAIYGSSCGTELIGNLTITGAITDLAGISGITKVGGNLTLSSLSNLTDFSGLENLTEVGRLSINSNQNITDLLGLSGITNIVEGLSISNNQSLTSLNGLQNIVKAQRLSINNNDVLDNLSGLESLTELSGSINIVGNELLTSLAGIENIASGISSITVSDNPKLTACSIESICSYLEVSNGSFFRNGSGCNNQAEVEAGCAECPETITLSSQEDVDNFTAIYGSSCGTELIGNLTITGAITDLAGISGITKVGGNLTLSSLSNLIDFSGLENLTEVGSLSINSNQNITDLIGLSGITNIVEGLSILNNQALTNLAGLSAITTIGGHLSVSSNQSLSSLTGLNSLESANRLSIYRNDLLEDLSGLESIQSLNGNISIYENVELISLSGIENIASGISSITVKDNSKLTACSIESICSYLEVSNGSFFRNDSGCNSQEEVKNQCNIDECPDDPNKTNPGVCGCGVEDLDTDGDGVLDCNDNEINSPCPDDVNSNGVSNDDDNDGVANCIDQEENSECPGFVNSDGVSLDSDEDGILDCNDNCIAIANSNQDDLDGDEKGDVCDEDIDGDGVLNENDCAPMDASIFEGEIWYLDSDNDGFGVEDETIVSCEQPAGYSSKFGDCNDDDNTINPGAQYFEYSSGSGFQDAVINPQIGGPADNYQFEVVYYDLRNVLPPFGYPRVVLDYENNGIYTNSKDRTIVLEEYDTNDTNTADGKVYVGSISPLETGKDYALKVEVENAGCNTSFGPFNYPDVLVDSNLEIFADDIEFDQLNPGVSSPLQITATITNSSDIAAENFQVGLINQYDESINYPNKTIEYLAPHQSTQIVWDIITPNEDAWCPMQVVVDNLNSIEETNELDNTAVRPFTNGDYEVPGEIVVETTVSPIIGYGSTHFQLYGYAYYIDTAIELEDPSVAGAAVSLQLVNSGRMYNVNTNSRGRFSLSIQRDELPGIYDIVGSVTDFTLTGDFDNTYEVIDCELADLQVSIQLNPTAFIKGNSTSGQFVVLNRGCVAVTESTTMSVSQSGGSPSLPVSYTIPPLGVNETYRIDIEEILFENPGNYSICATVDETNIVTESIENNSTCRTVTVYDDTIDLVNNLGPRATSYACNVQGRSPTFTLYNAGAVKAGESVASVDVYLDGNFVITNTATVSEVDPFSFKSFTIPFAYDLPGIYRFDVRLDHENPGVVDESNEENNFQSYNIELLECLPDITVSNCGQNLFVDPLNPDSGTDVTYKATIKNSGRAAIIDPIRIEFNDGDNSYFVTHNSGLSVNESVEVSVDAPLATTGNTLTVIADVDELIIESNELNEGEGDLCYEYSLFKPYAPTDQFWGNNVFSRYSNVVPWININNSGLYTPTDTKVKFEVSGPGISGTINLAEISTGQINSCTTKSVIMQNSFVFNELGTYTFTFTADSNNQQNECDETNNVYTRVVQVVDSKPDMFVLSSFINPSLLNPDINEEISFNVTYSNAGSQNINENMKLKVLVDEVEIDVVENVAGLLTNTNQTVSIPTAYSSSISGAHIVRVIIDSDNEIIEGNENNNEATRSFIVGESFNLFFNSFTTNIPAPSIGEVVSLNVVVENEGDFGTDAEVLFYFRKNDGTKTYIGKEVFSITPNENIQIAKNWTATETNTTLIAEIVTQSDLEFNLQDNSIELALGTFKLEFETVNYCEELNEGSLTVNPSGGTAPYTFEWNTGETTQTLVAESGSYIVKVVDANGLEAIASAVIQNNPDCSETITAGQPEVCTQMITLIIDDANNNEWHKILDANGNIAAQINPNGNNLGNVFTNVYLSSSDGAAMNDNGTSYLRRAIQIEPEFQPETDVSVRLYILQDEFNDLMEIDQTINSISDLIWEKKSGASCDTQFANDGESIITMNGPYTSNGFYSEFKVNSFSTFYAGSSALLPVELVYFNGISTENGNELTWETATENNTSHFNVQQSTDGLNWNVIGDVNAVGFSRVTQNYNFIDEQPQQQSFYRLDIVDFDGFREYSNIIEINSKNITENQFVIYPNPALNEFKVSNNSGEDIQSISIYSMNGTLVRNVTNDTDHAISITDLAKGVYIVFIQTERKMIKHKLVKK